jgi:hypothetical protein
MTGKHIAGILVAACLGAVIAAGQARQPTVTDTPAIIIGGCWVDGSGAFLVELGGANEYGCPGTGVPLHGVPMPSAGHVRNLRVTGDGVGNALEGSVVTVYLNGSPTLLACTVGAAGTCRDAVDIVRAKPGDELGATFQAPGPGIDNMTMSLEVCLSDRGNGCS